MTAIVLRGDARRLPLADDSVDLIVTSPPYFNLRSYEDSGAHYDGQIGAEPSPADYIDGLLDCTEEWLRVLKPTGSLFVNLGDCYSAYNNNRGAGGKMSSRPDERRGQQGRGLFPGAPRAKSLMGLPWRYALRCIDELDLILRAEMIWSKPNGMPESVADRVRRSHEQWFHFVQQPRYFAAVNEIRAPHKRTWTGQNGGTHDRADHYNVGLANGTAQPHPLGALPGSVWEVATEPLQIPEWLGDGHYAAFPLSWPRRLITGWCPPAGVVLDPFGGTGSTALVADVFGRTGITIDYSADYCRVAAWRTSDLNERARAAQEPKPAPVAAGQMGLFDG